VVEKFLVPSLIPNDIWQHDRFSKCLFSDEFNNLVFPHYSGKKVVGLELYNTNFNGFYPGSKKSTWFTKRNPDDDALILTNLAINSLFIFREHKNLIDRSWCMSTGGDFGEDAFKMIRYALDKYRGQKVILAFDASDEANRAKYSVETIIKDLKLNRSVEVISPEKVFWVNN